MATQLANILKHWIVKWVCELYLNKSTYKKKQWKIETHLDYQIGNLFFKQMMLISCLSKSARK